MNFFTMKLITYFGSQDKNYCHLWLSWRQDLVNKSADPSTERRISSLESTYVPQINFDISNNSGGTCVRTSWTTLLAASTSSLSGSSRLMVTSMSPEMSFTAGRLDGISSKGTTFLHFLLDNFCARTRWALDWSRESWPRPMVFSSFRYSLLPACILEEELTTSLPLTPILSWDQLRPLMTMNPMSEVNERRLFNLESLATVKHTSPIRTLAGGWRRVSPMCFPVEYKKRHFPGINSSQCCIVKVQHKQLDAITDHFFLKTDIIISSCFQVRWCV